MLGLQRRIVLEDHQGVKHAHILLDTIGDRFFVLLPPEQAEEIAALQVGPAGSLDLAVPLLAEHVVVMDVRGHCFVPCGEVPGLLRRSKHHALVMAGARMAELPALSPDETSSLAFQNECRRRASW